jgi:hypothetical protein
MCVCYCAIWHYISDDHIFIISFQDEKHSTESQRKKKMLKSYKDFGIESP